MKRQPKRRLAVVAGLLLLPACSMFTSITHETNGDYVLTGLQGSAGFVWICSYDPQTMTLTVKQKEPK